MWARERVAGNERRAAMQEAVPGTFEMQRHRLNFFTWNAGHLTRSGSEPFSATRTHSLLMEYLFSVHCQILLLQKANLLDAVSQSDAQAQAQGAILRRDPHFAPKKEDAAAVLGKLVHDRLNDQDITVIKDPAVPDLAIVQWGVAVHKHQVVSAGRLKSPWAGEKKPAVLHFLMATLEWTLQDECVVYCGLESVTVLTFHYSNEEAHNRDLAVTLYSDMFRSAFEHRPVFAGGDGNKTVAVLPGQTQSYLHQALDALKSEDSCAMVDYQVYYANNSDVQVGIDFGYSDSPGPLKARQIPRVAQITHANLRLRPGDSDSHHPLQVQLESVHASAGQKRVRSDASKIFRKQQRRQKK